MVGVGVDSDVASQLGTIIIIIQGSRALGHGVSDHCDLAYYGKQLEYPFSYDPFRTTLDALCDHWSEWDGMRVR